MFQKKSSFKTFHLSFHFFSFVFFLSMMMQTQQTEKSSKYKLRNQLALQGPRQSVNLAKYQYMRSNYCISNPFFLKKLQ